MELVEPCRRHRDGCGIRRGVPLDGFQGRQPMGQTGSVSVSVWHAGELCGVDGLSRAAYLRAEERTGTGGKTVEMEGAAQTVGPCGHLLAHRRFVLAADTGGAAHAGLLGVVAVFVCVGVCDSGNHRELHQAEGALERGDVLLHRHGAECAGSLQAAD